MRKTNINELIKDYELLHYIFDYSRIGDIFSIFEARYWRAMALLESDNYTNNRSFAIKGFRKSAEEFLGKIFKFELVNGRSHDQFEMNELISMAIKFFDRMKGKAEFNKCFNYYIMLIKSLARVICYSCFFTGEKPKYIDSFNYLFISLIDHIIRYFPEKEKSVDIEYLIKSIDKQELKNFPYVHLNCFVVNVKLLINIYIFYCREYLSKKSYITKEIETKLVSIHRLSVKIFDFIFGLEGAVFSKTDAELYLDLSEILYGIYCRRKYKNELKKNNCKDHCEFFYEKKEAGNDFFDVILRELIDRGVNIGEPKLKELCYKNYGISNQEYLNFEPSVSIDRYDFSSLKEETKVDFYLKIFKKTDDKIECLHSVNGVGSSDLKVGDKVIYLALYKDNFSVLSKENVENLSASCKNKSKEQGLINRHKKHILFNINKVRCDNKNLLIMAEKSVMVSATICNQIHMHENNPIMEKLHDIYYEILKAKKNYDPFIVEKLKDFFNKTTKSPSKCVVDGIKYDLKNKAKLLINNALYIGETTEVLEQELANHTDQLRMSGYTEEKSRGIRKKRATVLMKLGRYEDAVNDYNELTKDELAIQTFKDRGHAFFKLKKYKEALDDFNHIKKFSLGDEDVAQWCNTIKGHWYYLKYDKVEQKFTKSARFIYILKEEFIVLVERYANIALGIDNRPSETEVADKVMIALSNLVPNLTLTLQASSTGAPIPASVGAAITLDPKPREAITELNKLKLERDLSARLFMAKKIDTVKDELKIALNNLTEDIANDYIDTILKLDYASVEKFARCAAKMMITHVGSDKVNTALPIEKQLKEGLFKAEPKEYRKGWLAQIKTPFSYCADHFFSGERKAKTKLKQERQGIMKVKKSMNAERFFKKSDIQTLSGKHFKNPKKKFYPKRFRKVHYGTEDEAANLGLKEVLRNK